MVANISTDITVNGIERNRHADANWPLSRDHTTGDRNNFNIAKGIDIEVATSINIGLIIDIGSGCIVNGIE